MRYQELTQGSLMPKIKILGQKLWPAGPRQTDKQTNRQTDKQTNKQTEIVKTEGPIEFFGSFFSFISLSMSGPKNKTKQKKAKTK